MRVLIVGFTRRTSYALARYLLTVKKYSIIVTDSINNNDKQSMIAELSQLGIVINKLGDQSVGLIKSEKPELVFVSPGVPSTIPLLQEARILGIPCTNDIDFFTSEFPSRRLVAITGTDGKTSSVTWLYKMLSASMPTLLAGNVGTPLFAFAGSEYQEHIHVLELSSFQLEYASSFHAKAAALLNIAPDHLDRYPNVDAYAKAKKGIFNHMNPTNLALLNADDAYTPMFREGLEAQIQYFSYTKADADWFVNNETIFNRGVPFYDCRKLKVLGHHQYQNAMIVAGIARFLGLSDSQIEEGLSSFEGVEHRLQYLGEKKGVKYYNDSKATSPQALKMALTAFSQKVLLLAGGKSKGVPFDELEPLIKQTTKAVYPFGAIASELKKAWNLPKNADYTLEEAFWAAVNDAKSGDVVLFSPGGQSFDAFIDYEERGKFFQKLVNQLPDK
ncbi:MAG: UDP-N-acetylmuramoyl-L-alanine--D-glutamate ligase [Brevinema sp.]